MTASNFQACLDIILQSEGSAFVDDPQDPGGATRYGVTLNTLTGWLGRQATIADVEALTPAAVAPIYSGDYWSPAHCPDCPVGVDLMIFDCSVNQGVGRSIRTLQQALAVTPDGLFGPATAAALSTCNWAQTIDRIAATRAAFYRSLPTFPRFGTGWLARVVRTQGLAQQMAVVAASAP